MDGQAHVAGEDTEAVATVACDLLSPGTFRTIAMPAGAGDVEKCFAGHFEFCLTARAALLGIDRSMVWWRERRLQLREKECRGEMPRMAQLSKYICSTMAGELGSS